MKWKSEWIWDNSGEHPRNHWVCFRQTFELRKKVPEVAVLNITADSRYVLYINGRRIGFGPVRSWPSEQSYDSYRIEDYLHPGKNVIAVLVTHYGISTCQYIEGRGGLIAQVDFIEDGEIITSLCTDNAWKVCRHYSYRKSAVRISNCLSWTEIFDAQEFDSDWTLVDYDDSDWDNAISIGFYGMKPWTELVERDIPFLTEEPFYPKRIVSVKEVVPVKNHASVDLRPNFFPGEFDNNNKKMFLGYLASKIISPRDTEGYIGMYYDPHGVFECVFKVNGKRYSVKNGQKTRVALNKGENLFIIDASGTHHNPAVNLILDFDEFLTFSSPKFGGEYQFVTIGPFDKKTIIETGKPMDETLDYCDDYYNVWEASSNDDLAKYKTWIKPVLPEHVCFDNVVIPSMFKKIVKECQITCETQNMIIPNNSATTIKPIKSRDIEYIIDFGREYSGFIEFDIDAHDGVVFDFFMYESMHDEIIEHTFSLNNTLRYITRNGRQRFRSEIRRGFRYIMMTVRNLREPVKVYSIKLYQSNYPVAENGQFMCSDYLLNRIWEISRDTTKLCMEDTFVDCPAYEQNFWVGDSRIESLVNYYTFGDYNIVKRCLKLVSKSLYRSPLPESHVPSGWQSVLTAWALLWVTSCREYYDFSGDSSFLDDIYPSLIEAARRFVKFLNKDGLLDIAAWNMLDWAPMDTPNNGIVTHQNALLVKALNEISYIADILKAYKDREWLSNTAYNIKAAINKHLWSEKEKAYIDSIHSDGECSNVVSLQTNLMVYLCDCAVGKRRSLLERYLIEPPEHFIKIASPFVYFFYYEALVKLGKHEKVLDSIREIWGYMLENGATTCWEGWRLIEKHFTRSHCHAWSAGPAYFLGAYVLGIRPLKPAFSQVIIEPYLCGLNWVKGTVPVPGGCIEVEYKDEGSYLDLKVVIPQGIKATVVLPIKEYNKIRFNGEFVKQDILVI